MAQGNLFKERQTKGILSFSSYSKPPARLGYQGRHFTYKGTPIYLIGSGLETLNLEGETPQSLLTRWRSYLEVLAQSQTQYVRFRLRLFPWAFLREEAGKVLSPWVYRSHHPIRYDLSTFDPLFWELLWQMAQEAHRREILLEFVLFDAEVLPEIGAGAERDGASLVASSQGLSLSLIKSSPGSSLWQRHPWNEAVGGPLKRERGEAFYQLAEPENFHLWAENFSPEWGPSRQNQWYQQHYVLKVIQTLGGFDNVYWELLHNLRAVDALRLGWIRHWVQFLRHYDPFHRLITLSVPYGFWREANRWIGGEVDLLLLHGAGFPYEKHTAVPYTFAQLYRENPFGCPLMDDQTDWFTGEGDRARRPTSVEVKVERYAFWQAFVSGGHISAVAYQGLSKRPIHDWLKVFSQFIEGTDFVNLVPDNSVVAQAPVGLFHHSAHNPGKESVSYFTTDGAFSGGEVLLALRQGNFLARYIDPRTGRCLYQTWLKVPFHGRVRLLLPPFEEDMVLHIEEEGKAQAWRERAFEKRVDKGRGLE